MIEVTFQYGGDIPLGFKLLERMGKLNLGAACCCCCCCSRPDLE
ncbi:MAG: hypothetical protein ACPLW7_06195 [Minisyncoccia bacterium]